MSELILTYSGTRININLSFAIALIQKHFDNNEEEFRTICETLMNKLFETGEDELARYIQAQLFPNTGVDSSRGRTMIPKLAKGGVIKPPIKPVRPMEDVFSIFMTQQEMILEIEHQKKIIDRLSRKIQNKNKKYRQLQARKMPPTLYGNKVVIVPDSIANKIMVADKEFFDMGVI